MRHLTSPLKRRRCVHPEDDAFPIRQTAPTVRLRTLEVEAVAGFEDVAFDLVEPQFELTLEDVDQLFADVPVGAAAARSRRDSHQMRLHQLSLIHISEP